MFIGVYENYNTAAQMLESGANLFDACIWTESVKYWTENSINNAKNPNHPSEWYLREFITILAVESSQQQRIRVLDFG